MFVPKDGLTPLLWSAKQSHADVCSTLLDCGAEINASDNSGRYKRTPRSQTGGPAAAANALKTRVSCVFLCCRTALMLASECSAVSVVEVLLQRGADLSAVDSQGHNVGHYANVSGKPEVTSALAAALKKQQIPGKHTERAERMHHGCRRWF